MQHLELRSLVIVLSQMKPRFAVLTRRNMKQYESNRFYLHTSVIRFVCVWSNN